MQQNAEWSGSTGRIRTVTICGSVGPICRSVINVGLRLGLGFGLGLGLGLGFRLGFGLGIWFNLTYAAGKE